MKRIVIGILVVVVFAALSLGYIYTIDVDTVSEVKQVIEKTEIVVGELKIGFGENKQMELIDFTARNSSIIKNSFLEAFWEKVENDCDCSTTQYLVFDSMLVGLMEVKEDELLLRINK